MTNGTINGLAYVATPLGMTRIDPVPLSPEQDVCVGMSAGVDTAYVYDTNLNNPLHFSTFNDLGCVTGLGADLDGTYGPTPPYEFFVFEPGHIEGTVGCQTTTPYGPGNFDLLYVYFTEVATGDPVYSDSVGNNANVALTISIDLTFSVAVRLAVRQETVRTSAPFVQYASGAINLLYT